MQVLAARQRYQARKGRATVRHTVRWRRAIGKGSVRGERWGKLGGIEDERGKYDISAHGLLEGPKRRGGNTENEGNEVRQRRNRPNKRETGLGEGKLWGNTIRDDRITAHGLFEARTLTMLLPSWQPQRAHGPTSLRRRRLHGTEAHGPIEARSRATLETTNTIR